MHVRIYEPLLDRLSGLSCSAGHVATLVGFTGGECVEAPGVQCCTVVECFVSSQQRDTSFIDTLPGGVSVVGVAVAGTDAVSVHRSHNNLLSQCSHAVVLLLTDSRQHAPDKCDDEQDDRRASDNSTHIECHVFSGGDDGGVGGCALHETAQFSRLTRTSLLGDTVLLTASCRLMLHGDSPHAMVEPWLSLSRSSQVWFVEQARGLLLSTQCEDGAATCHKLAAVGTQPARAGVLPVDAQLQAVRCPATAGCRAALTARHTQSHVTAGRPVRACVTVQCVAMVLRQAALSHAAAALSQSLARQLLQYARLMEQRQLSADKTRVLHFWPDCCGTCISLVYADCVDDVDAEASLSLSALNSVAVRLSLHRTLLLPEDRPLFRPANALRVATTPTSSSHCKTTPEHCTAQFDGGRFLCDVHVGVGAIVAGAHVQTATVRGHYSYHHYMQHGLDDSGWGCAYRSLQTLASWFCWQGYSSLLPLHRQIQQCLVDLGDKPSSFVGSRQWIGSAEVAFCLDSLLQVQSRLLHVSCGADMGTHARQLLHHFREEGSPVMVGGGVLAHTLLGVSFDEASGDVAFLVLDPHYTGDECLATVQKRGWCGWKKNEFWDSTAYYNLCMPLRPRCV